MNRQKLLAQAKPILFNTEMVQAILSGRKTVTRRVIKPRYCDSVFETHNNVLCETEPYTEPVSIGNGMSQHKIRRFIECKPRYKVGDILYVRETWSFNKCENCRMCVDEANDYFKGDAGCWVYRTNYGTTEDDTFPPSMHKWHPSLHMTKSAARIFLRVTGVRAERLQDISVLDAKNEGTRFWANGCKDGLAFGCYNGDKCIKNECKQPILYFKELWNSTIKKTDIDTYGWNANPFVWVYEFERVNIDE